MLRAIRETLSGWVLIVIVVILALPFALFGVNSYFDTNIATYVAKVGEKEITPSDFSQALNTERNYYRQILGADADLSFMNTPERKRATLDRLVDGELARQDAEAAGITVPPGRLREQILAVEAFQVAGQFNGDQYLRVLQANGLTRAGYEESLVEDTLKSEISTQLRASSIITDAEIDRFVRLRDQTRSFNSVVLLGVDAEIDSEVSDEQAQAYFDEHSADYMRAEQVMVDFVEIKADDLVADQEPTEEELQTLYHDQSTRFVTPEQRLASHILISIEGSDAEAERAALSKAEEVKARLDGGEEFAALAKEVSSDIGSSEQGGDLGWLEKGITDPSFEAALFELEAGAVSDPVRGADGYHLIQLREIRPEQAKPFAEVREELAAEWKQNRRDQAFNELSGKLVDEVNANPKNLQRAADGAKLTVQKSPLFERGFATGLFANPSVREAAFNDLAIKRNMVSDPIVVAPEHLVVLQVSEHKPTEPKAFDEVKEQVIVTIQNERRAEALAAKAAALKERLKGGEGLSAVAAELGKPLNEVSAVVRSAANQDGRILAEVFKLPRPGEQPVRDVVELSPQEWLAIELTAVADGDPSSLDEAARESVRQQISNHWATLEFAGYLEHLRAVTEIDINEKQIP